MAKFTLRNEISIGELLTFVSIIVSAISFLVSWSLDRNVRIKNEANAIRREVAETMNDINSMSKLHLSFYDLLEEDFVETSQITIVEKNAVKARDYLWKRMYDHRNDLVRQTNERQLQIAYINLLPYKIVVDSLYITASDRLVKLQEKQFELILKDLESTVIDFDPKATNQTAVLGNELRMIKNFYRENHIEYSAIALKPINDYLRILYNTPDRKLVFK